MNFIKLQTLYNQRNGSSTCIRYLIKVHRTVDIKFSCSRNVIAHRPDIMSGKEYAMDSGSGGVREVKVHIIKPRRHTHCVELETEDGRGIAKLSSRSSDYVYVNSAFVGSVNNIAGDSVDRIQDPPTTVIREQYWACSKWPYGQKILALAVGILLGALIGLSISYAFKNVGADDVIGGIFRSNPVGE